MQTDNIDLLLGDVPAFGVHDGAKVVECSPELATMFGYNSPAEVVGKTALEFIDQSAQNHSVMEVIASGGGPYDSIGLRADGVPFRIQISAHPVQFRGNQARLFFVRDLSPRALVVDDEKVVGNMVCLLCRQLGYRTLAADSAASALRIFRARAFAFVLTDIQMPRVSGIELASRLREADPNVPIVFMSGTEIPVQIDENSRFLEKPFGIPDLARVLGELPERAKAGLVDPPAVKE